MKRQLFRLLATFCSLALVLTIVPLSVSAETLGNGTEQATSQMIADSSMLDEVAILDEDVSQREESTKFFRREDGTVTAAIYDNPVHYLKDGKWEDIDNTLISDGEENGVTYYTNKASNFKVRIPDELHSEAPITVTNGEHTLMWTLLDGESHSSVVTPIRQAENATSTTTTIKTTTNENSVRIINEDKMRVHKQHSSVAYTNVFNNVNLSYDIISNRLKESIILEKYQKNASYSFYIQANGLRAELQDNGAVYFYDEANIAFVVASPYMFDANNAFSSSIQVRLESMKGGYRYTLTPSDAWLADAERQYPVTIDPTVTTSLKRAEIEDAQTYEYYPSQPYGEAHLTYAGSVIISGTPYEYRTFVKLTMPVASTTYRRRVVEAKLRLTYYGENNTHSQGSQINLYRLTGDWSEDTITWNNSPLHDTSAIVDYVIGKNGSGESVFDITALADSWINNPSQNFGVMIKGAKKNTTTPDNVCWYSEDTEATAYESVRPKAEITYRDCTGIEDYWSYTALAAGAAGTALVNNYAGDLVFTTPLFNGTGERMPVSLSAVYNGYSSCRVYATDINNNSQTSICRGWRLNVQQTLLPSSAFGLTGTAANNFPYVYTDADGTNHYIYCKDDVYRDEDGLGLTLTFPTTSTYLLTDEKGNTIKFNSAGNATHITDSNGNAITISYQPAASAAEAGNHEDVLAGQKIDHITDGAGLTYTFTYCQLSSGGTNNYVRKITDSAGRSVLFSRDEQFLTKITYPDGTYSSFDSSQTLPYSLNSVTDTNGYKLEFTYSADTDVRCRVSQIQEYSSSGATGQKITFDYSKPNQTTTRSMGRDNIYGGEETGEDDIINVYQFDTVGRVTSCQTRLGDGGNAFASVSEYTSHEMTDYESPTIALKQRNRITSSATFNKISTNLITNGNAESTTGWTLSTDGTTSEHTAVAGGNYGQKALRLKNTAVDSGGGCGDLRQNITGLTKSTAYTLSAYVKIEGAAVTTNTDTTGVYIAIRTISGETVQRGYSTRLTANTNAAINGGWRRISATLTLPDDCTSVRVALAMRNMTGTVYFDGIQLETGSVANEYNMLENSSFEKFPSGGGMPTSWTPMNCEYTINSSNGTVYDGCSTVTKKADSHSVRLTGVHDTSVGIYQNIPITGSANDTYIVSGWAAGFPVSTTNHGGRFEITAYVGYSNSSTGDFYEEIVATAKFNTNVTGWQYSACAFTLGTPKPGYTPSRIRIRPTYSKQVNHAYFDFIHLYRDVAQTYTYDEDGNLKSVAANAEQQSTMKYSNHDLISATDTAGYAYTYTYDSKHNVKTATSARGVKTTYTRNDIGQVIETTVQNSSQTMILKTEQRHTDATEVNGVSVKAGAYTDEIIDQYGEKTTYDIDLLKGRTKSVTDPKGITTSYSYVSSNDDRVKSVSAGGSSVSYAYTGSHLSGLTFGGDTYAFSVDGFGNPTKTTVGGKTLSTNTYAAHNGQLTQVAYGNGDKRTYSYTRLGQVASQGNESGSQYTWQYNANAVNVSHNDLVNNLTHKYDWDTIGRLIRHERTDRTSGAYQGSVEYGYDDRNNLTRVTMNAGGRTTNHLYSYDTISGVSDTSSYKKDNLLTRFTIFAARYEDYSYDTLNRLKKKVFSTTRPIVTQYMYRTSTRGEDGGTEYRTTGLYAEYLDTKSYRYRYDKAGNIVNIDRATIADPTASSVSVGSYADYRDYTYDSLSQMTKSIERFANGTVTTDYTYDAYGNITSKAVTKNGTTTTIPYTYGTDSDAGWSKLLKSYNGQTINYDAIGNPTTYLGATLGWSSGRQLTSYTKGSNSITYTYDADGLRASKTVNGVKSTYLYSNGLLMYERRGGNDLYYWYNANGHLAAVEFFNNSNGTWVLAYALTNSMGDVLGLYYGDGTLVTTYEYDAWGNLVYMNDTSALGIGTLNPIRYRSYYYDTDTGFYYCQSRYYNPQVGRWVNADGQLNTDAILGSNMFAYSYNNPVNLKDNGGNRPISALSVVSETADERAKSFACMNPVRKTVANPKPSPVKPSTPPEIIVKAEKTSEEKKDFLEAVYARGKADEPKTKIPAALFAAQACLESGYGTSPMAVNSNNLFGFVGYTYESIEECIASYEGALTRNSAYSSLFGEDLKGWVYGIGPAGYCSEPDYGDKLWDIIINWDLQ